MISHPQISLYSFYYQIHRYRRLLLTMLVLMLVLVSLMQAGMVFADEVTGGAGCIGC